MEATTTIAGCSESLADKRGTTIDLPQAGQSIARSLYSASQTMCWLQCGQANRISLIEKELPPVLMFLQQPREAFSDIAPNRQPP